MAKKTLKRKPVATKHTKSAITTSAPIVYPAPAPLSEKIENYIISEPTTDNLLKYSIANNRFQVPVQIPYAKQVPYGQELSDDVLLRQIYAESAFNPKAVSSAGYKGLGQIGKDVIEEYKKATGVKNVDPFNINDNLAVQKWAMTNLYNADFINKPDQDPEIRLAKALAGYNWGRGHLSDYLSEQKKKGVDIYNSKDWMNDLPTETREYIEKILYKSNDRFNDEFKKAIGNNKYKNITERFIYDPNKVVIDDNMGQWAHPGEVTRIASNDITMQGVPYPVLGVGADGEQHMMYPNEEHTFNEAPVTEYPMMQAKYGGWLNQYALGGDTTSGTTVSNANFNVNDLIITDDELREQAGLYIKRIEDCKAGDAGCLEQANRYYDRFVSPVLPGSLNHWQIYEHAGVSSGKGNPRSKEYGPTADSWDIHGLLQEKGAIKKYAAPLNNPFELRNKLGSMTMPQQEAYWKTLNLPVGTIIGMGDHEYFENLSYNKKKGLVDNSHSAVIVGYNEQGLPVMYDYGHITPITNPTFVNYAVTNITIPRENQNYTFDYVKKNTKSGNYTPLNIKVPNDIYNIVDPDEFDPFLSALENYKPLYANALGLSDEQYDELAKQAVAIALTETKGGNDASNWRYGVVPSYLTDKMGLGDSQGITQFTTTHLKNPDFAKIMAKFPLRPNATSASDAGSITYDEFDPWDPYQIAGATLALLKSNINPSKANLKTPGNNQSMSPAMLAYYQYNTAKTLRKGEAQGDNANVKRFMDYYNKINLIKPSATPQKKKLGGWLEEYAPGGKIKPIVVSSKDDPKYKAYQDSLNAYNMDKSFEKFINSVEDNKYTYDEMKDEVNKRIDERLVKLAEKGPNRKLKTDYSRDYRFKPSGYDRSETYKVNSLVFNKPVRKVLTEGSVGADNVRKQEELVNAGYKINVDGVWGDESKKAWDEYQQEINAGAQQWEPNQEDLRADGTQKGTGYFGVMKRPDGDVSTEISVGVTFDGKEVQIPLMVPTLSKEELDYLLNNPADKEDLLDTPIGKSIMDKAVNFSKQRAAKGLSPFYQEGEPRQAVPGQAPSTGRMGETVKNPAGFYDQAGKNWQFVNGKLVPAPRFKRGGVTWLNEYAEGGPTMTFKTMPVGTANIGTAADNTSVVMNTPRGTVVTGKANAPKIKTYPHSWKQVATDLAAPAAVAATVVAPEIVAPIAALGEMAAPYVAPVVAAMESPIVAGAPAYLTANNMLTAAMIPAGAKALSFLPADVQSGNLSGFGEHALEAGLDLLPLASASAPFVRNGINYAGRALGTEEGLIASGTGKKSIGFIQPQEYYDNLPPLTDKESLSVLDDLKKRINTPEGKKRLKELGIESEDFLNNLENNIKLSSDVNTQGYSTGFQIGINPNLPLKSQTMRHELEHFIQNQYNLVQQNKAKRWYDKFYTNAATNKRKFDALNDELTTIDKSLANLELNRTPENVDWITKAQNRKKVYDNSDFNRALLDNQEAVNYFHSGSSGREKSPMLAEVQQFMMDQGIIPKDKYINVTPEMVEDTYRNIVSNNSGNGKYLRLFNIMKPTKANYELIAKNLNKMLSIAPYAIPAATVPTILQNYQGLQKQKHGGRIFSAGGEKHKVYKKESPTGNGEGVKGHIMVTHPTMDKGKWDTIDLTEKSGAKTVAQGVAATRKWHRENPEYQQGGPTTRYSYVLDDNSGNTVFDDNGNPIIINPTTNYTVPEWLPQVNITATKLPKRGGIPTSNASQSNGSLAADLVLDAAQFVPGPLGVAASAVGIGKNLYEDDYVGAGLDLANIATAGGAKWLTLAADFAKAVGKANKGSRLAKQAKLLEHASNPNLWRTTGLTRDLLKVDKTGYTPTYKNEPKKAPDLITNPEISKRIKNAKFLKGIYK